MAIWYLASALGGAVGLAGIVLGGLLLHDPSGTALKVGVNVSGEAQIYGRFTGLRNVGAGGLLLWAACVLAVAHPPLAQPMQGVGIAWGAVQVCDTVLLFQIGSKKFACGAALMAVGSLAASVLAFFG